ncbi:MAG: hypothetical protein L3J20_07030 [Flavobacteriaceae bacterium]|nr:hypothetical protein [Flavobacteriaceae bacterium]
MNRKKKIEKVKKSDLIPDQYNDVYENDLKELESKIESEEKKIKRAISNADLSKINMNTFIYI